MFLYTTFMPKNIGGLRHLYVVEALHARIKLTATRLGMTMLEFITDMVETHLPRLEKGLDEAAAEERTAWAKGAQERKETKEKEMQALYLMRKREFIEDYPLISGGKQLTTERLRRWRDGHYPMMADAELDGPEAEG
jgi:hypothetical protein